MIRIGSFHLNAGTSCYSHFVDKHINVSNIELIYRFAPNSPIYDETAIDQNGFKMIRVTIRFFAFISQVTNNR